MALEKRSKGVTFWGYLLIYMGIIYGVITAVRNIWTLDILIPIFLVLAGSGILNLKNLARIFLLIFLTIELTLGTLLLPKLIPNNIIFKEGHILFGTAVLIMRFVFEISGIVFFSSSSVRKQFKKRDKL